MQILLLLIVVPMVEIWLLLQIGDEIGGLTTFGLVIATALLGVVLLRQQGLMTLQRLRSAAQSGAVAELPLALLEGVVLLISGVLLLTPGFVTDTIGLLLLLPPLRRALILGLLQRALKRRSTRPASASRTSHQRPPSRPQTLEGEFRRDDD